MGLDTATIAAALLHDVVEDTSFGEDSIRREFGEEVNMLVRAVTKISLVKKDSMKDQKPSSELKAREAAENIRLMLLATTRDVRVILIKLADKLHNMQTLGFQKPHKVERIAREVIDIYAPIAGRLGMFRMKSELEDLAFGALQPEEFETLQSELKHSRGDLEVFLKKITSILKQRLADIQLTARIDGRAKHLYSVYSKMQKYGKGIHEIYDLRGVRIIVDEIRDCYGALGIVHTLWPPLPGRFKDYIAMPKSNGYQSLHTTVVGPDGRPLEVQIRTQEMDERAEHGIAAHWLYKNDMRAERGDQGKLEWLRTLSRITQEFQGDSKDFIEDLRDELNPKDVYVFTPKGDIINLPQGSTVLDFAFRIHTDIGLRCKSAKVNDRIVPLRTELRSGDRIEIVTHGEPRPSPVWLRYLKSQGARQKVRGFFRRIEDETPLPGDSRTEVPDRPAKTRDLKELREIRIRRKTSTNPKDVPIEVAGNTDIPVRYAGCCSPVPGDRIVGFITRGRGVTIHRADCKHLPAEKGDQDRFIQVRWEGLTETYPVGIEISARDRQGLYLDLVQAISRTQTNILKAEADIPKHQNGTMKARFLVEVEHVDHLNEIIESMSQVSGVVDVKRQAERREEKKA
nr:bifunctional (p)ppGpp synthetase/guanosine-3',5'-bis(diphosphate) 3'-pyrophosphohydrolase [Leptonema illini]